MTTTPQGEAVRQLALEAAARECETHADKLAIASAQATERGDPGHAIVLSEKALNSRVCAKKIRDLMQGPDEEDGPWADGWNTRAALAPPNAAIPSAEREADKWKRRFMRLYEGCAHEHGPRASVYERECPICEAMSESGAAYEAAPSTSARDALEAAAQICESVSSHDNPMTAQDCADAIRALAPPNAAIPSAERCMCEACTPQGNPLAGEFMRFIACAICGNKRCPHATDHANACTNSNEPGQPGSSYAAPPNVQSGDSGHCLERALCVCGGDTPGVCATCPNWKPSGDNGPPAFHHDKSVPPIVLQVTPGASPPADCSDDGVQWFCPHCNPCLHTSNAKCRSPSGDSGVREALTKIARLETVLYEIAQGGFAGASYIAMTAIEREEREKKA